MRTRAACSLRLLRAAAAYERFEGQPENWGLDCISAMSSLRTRWFGDDPRDARETVGKDAGPLPFAHRSAVPEHTVTGYPLHARVTGMTA